MSDGGLSQMMRGQEGVAMLEALTREVADHLGCVSTLEAIKHRVYKDTPCGAWIAIDERGLTVGSIVEGMDAVPPTQCLSLREWDEMPEGAVGAWLDEALRTIEAGVDELLRDEEHDQEQEEDPGRRRVP